MRQASLVPTPPTWRMGSSRTETPLADCARMVRRARQPHRVGGRWGFGDVAALCLSTSAAQYPSAGVRA